MGQAAGKIVNWPEYNKGLVNNFRLDLWLDPQLARTWREEAREAGRGGRLRTYSPLSISFCCKFKELLGLSFRAAQGFLQGVFNLARVELPVPDYTTLCRRAAADLGARDVVSFVGCQDGYMAVVDSTGLKSRGMGEWLYKKHRPNSRRGWVKLHVLMDADSGQVSAAMVSDDKAGDSECLPDLLAASPARPGRLAGDGAYDDGRTRALCRKLGVEALVPPKRNAKLWMSPERDRAIKHDRRKGRGSWKKSSGYHVWSNVESFMGRFKKLFGAQVSCRSERGQIAQIMARLMCANGMARGARPIRDKYCKLRQAA